MMKKCLRTPLATAVLFALAAGLIGFGGVNAAAAAPRVESRQYGAEVVLSDMSTSLVETNVGYAGKTVASSAGSEALLEGLVPKDEAIVTGKEYQEELAVVNDGDIPQYVRVTVYRYWTDGEGKEIDLDPSLIDVKWNEADWTIDDDASTDERTVLYYSDVLAPGATSAPVTETIAIDSAVLTAIGEGGEFEYEGVTFGLKARVDAVQDHNGTQAMTGAWGRTN